MNGLIIKKVANIKVNTTSKVNLVNKLGLIGAKNSIELFNESDLGETKYSYRKKDKQIDKTILERITKMGIVEFKVLRGVGKYKKKFYQTFKDFEVLLSSLTVNEFVFLRNILRNINSTTEIKFV
jgi:hypothetical protein